LKWHLMLPLYFNRSQAITKPIPRPKVTTRKNKFIRSVINRNPY
jgi:hypothetical protein